MKTATKKIIKRKAYEITEEILLTLKDLSQVIPHPFESKSEHIQRLRRYSRGQITRGLGDLANQGLIKKIKRERKTYYGITDLGRARALKYQYATMPKKAKSNGFSTLVIFDIPEEKKKARGFLRRFLIQNGFTMLQRSVFIGRWEIEKEFKDILKELKIDSNVSIIEGRVLYNNT
jgi:DNA-binding transcriptional regulator PaaX